MILLPEWLHMLNYVKTFFSYPSTPPHLSNLLKSTCSTCSAFKIFQNIQNCNRHQSAQDAQAPKVFFLSGFHLWFLAFCTNMPEEFVVRFPLAPSGFVRLCCMIRVLWFSFFFKLTSLICFKKNQRISDFFSHQCQGHALVSVKMNVAPVHFWRKTFPKFNWF